MKTFGQNIISSLLLLLASYHGFVAATQQWYTANDGTKYLIETELKFNYLQAVGECARKDLQLVVINNVEKNAAIVELLNSFTEKPRVLWFDQQDEFNTELNTNRPFYSISTGQQNTFGYWDTNEPNNRNGIEHCAEMVRNSDYKWNDINCDARWRGYICEEHHLTTSYRRDLNEKRNIIYLTHTRTISDFDTQSQLINDINIKTRETTNSLMNMWRKSVEGINNDLPEAEKQKAFDMVTTATIQTMEGTLLNAENEISSITSLHAARLESDTAFIDGVLSN